MRHLRNNKSKNKSLRQRIKSGDTEGNENLSPSDDLWGNIDKALNKKKKNKKKRILLVFFFITICFSLFTLFHSANDHNQLDIVDQIDSNSENNIGEPSTEDETTLTKKIEKINQILDPNTSTSNDVGNKPLAHHNITLTNNTSQINNTTQINKEQQDTKSPIVNEHKNLGQKENTVETVFNTNAKQPSYINNYKPTFESQEDDKNTSSETQNAKTISEVSKETLNKSVELHQDKLFPLIEKLNARIYIDPEVLIMDQKPTIVSSKKSTHSFMFRSFASTTNYRIIKEQTLGNLDFTLGSSLSYGYEVHWKKDFNNQWELAIGFGIDHAHFTADYSINLNGPQSSIQDANGIYTLNYNQNLPSLAGGLTLDVEVKSTVEESEEDVFTLQLGHNYKTVTIPIQANYFFKKSAKMNLFGGVGIQYSKRLLSLDTGVELSDFTNKNYNLTSLEITPIVMNAQPFKINNISSIVQLGLQYSFNNSFSLQSDFRMTTPLQSIYRDQTFVVRSRQFQLGLGLIYKLP